MTEVIKVEDCGENIGDYDVQIYNAILIPKNATNGDVIKAVFPNATYKHIERLSGVNFTRAKGLNAFELYQDFYNEWWNALYKRGE